MSISADRLREAATVARELGLRSVTVTEGDVTVSFDAPPLPPKLEEPTAMTDEQRKEAEKAGHLAARTIRLRKMLGRPPTAAELEGDEALP